MSEAVREREAKLFAEVAELEDREARRDFLERHRELESPETVRKLSEEMNKTVRVDAQRAFALAEFAVLVSEAFDDLGLRALGLRAKGNALYALGNNRGALDAYEKAIVLFREAGEPTDQARTASSTIQPLILLGHYGKAFSAADSARRIFEERHDQHRLARLDNNVGNILHRQDRFDEALVCYERAYAGLCPYQDEDPEGIAGVLSNMATCLIVLNDFPRALETYERARAFSEDHQMPRLVAQSDYNIAYLYYLRGEYSRALQMIATARREAEKVGDHYHSALCDIDESEIFLELNLFDEAAEMARRAFDKFEQQGIGYEAAKSLANLAFALNHKGETTRALDLFQRARKLFVRERNRVWPSLIDLYQALVLSKQGRLFESRELCDRALSFFETSALPGKAVLCHLLLAQLNLEVSDVRAARRECQSALASLQTIDAPFLSFQAHFLLGRVEADDQDASFESYQNARKALEDLRSQLQGEVLRIAFMKNKLAVYEELFDLSLTRSSDPEAKERAFGYMEQAKCRAMRDLIFRPTHALPPLNPAEEKLVGRVRGIREELNWFYHRMYQEELRPESPSPERLAHLHTEAKSREGRLLDAMRELPPPEAALLSSTTIPLESVRAALPSDSALLEYFAVRDRFVVSVVTRDALEIVAVGSRARVGMLIRMLQFQLAKFRLGTRYVSDFEDVLMHATLNHLKELYVELIEPVREMLHGRHLLFVPHGPLHQLPFHALFDGQQYLCDAFTISYAPSSSIYVHCHDRVANRDGKALVLGVEDPQAPFIRQEVEAVAAILPDAVALFGERATLETIRDEGPASRLVHIAAHGYFRGDNPMFSAIRLGTSNLSLYDLYQLRLPVELVTLSGCATGMNVVVGGDELLGLVRGLLYAGSQSVMVSLWDVQDKTTAELMTSFYARLGDGRDKAKALQQAMIELRERHPHPYYWAPFVLIGKTVAS